MTDPASTDEPADTDDALPPGGIRWTDEEIDARWRSAWRPAQAAARLAGIDSPWCVAAGWALDLFRGEQTRDHGDLEIAAPAADFPKLRARLADYAFDVPADGKIWPDAGEDALAATHQTWVRDPATGGFLVDIFREPHDGDTWICRRDPAIRLPYPEIVEHTADGIPYLIPELVLLFKAKAARPKDRRDFDGVLPLLVPARRARLAGWLDQAHPGHPWAAALAS